MSCTKKEEAVPGVAAEVPAAAAAAAAACAGVVVPTKLRRRRTSTMMGGSLNHGALPILCVCVCVCECVCVLCVMEGGVLELDMGMRPSLRHHTKKEGTKRLTDATFTMYLHTTSSHT